MILFLVLMPLCIALAYNLYHAALYYARTVENVQAGRIEHTLTEGLLHVGCTLCTHNKAMLMAWGKNEARTMHLTFPSWPTDNKNSLLASYSGTISITSEKGFLTVSCILQGASKNCMSGSCSLVCKKPKDPASALIIKNWSIT